MGSPISFGWSFYLLVGVNFLFYWWGVYFIMGVIFLFFSFFYRTIGLMSRVFANDPGDWGSISGRVIPKTQKMILDAALLNTQHY